MQNLRDDLENRFQLWDLLREFGSRFLRPFTPQDALPQREIFDWEASNNIRLPAALIEFYSLCGNAHDIWNRQDTWLPPSRIRRKDDVLVFWVENQGNWCIGIRNADLQLEDPPVVWDAASWTYGTGNDTEFTVLTDSVSRFAANMSAYVAKFFDRMEDAHIGYTYDVDQFLGVLDKNYARCHLQRPWVCGHEAYFQDSETFIEVSEGDGFVYPIFKSSQSIDRFSSLIHGMRFQWESQPRSD